MKIVLSWDEICVLIQDAVAQKYGKGVGLPQFKKDHGSYDGGVGDAYDIPSEVWLEVIDEHQTPADRTSETIEWL
jgi:hypothetical protein